MKPAHDLLVEVPYLFEAPTEYAQAIRQATNLGELRSTLKEWEPLAWDAYEASLRLSETEWGELCAGWNDRRKQRRQYAEKYGAILVPETMLKVSLVAGRFFAPWGLVFERLKVVGKVTLQGNHWVIDIPTAEESQP